MAPEDLKDEPCTPSLTGFPLAAETTAPRIPAWLTPNRLSFYLAGYLLTQGMIFLVLDSTSGVLDRQDRVRGRDFLNFYVNGKIVAHGEAARLYDADFFKEIQEESATVSETRPRYYPVYPPTTALLFSPLARLSYPLAIFLWWLVLTACFVVTGYYLLSEIQPAPAWQRTAILALAAFTPVWNTFVNGQLAGILLVLFYGGLKLHERNQGFWAGCLLSLLAVKPQFAVGPFLWMLFRFDWKMLAGFCLGGLLQVGSVAAILGHEVLIDFVNKGTRNALEMARVDHITPDHQHSLGGVLTNLIGQDNSDQLNWVHLAVAVVAAGLLLKIVWSNRRALPSPLKPTDHNAWAASRREYAALVIFSVFLTPHLLTYDLALLLIPVAFLWALGKDAIHFEELKIGTVVYLSAIPTFLYYFTFSLVPVALLWALYRLARRSPIPGGMLSQPPVGATQSPSHLSGESMAH
jgi:hypothetical protein